MNDKEGKAGISVEMVHKFVLSLFKNDRLTFLTKMLHKMGDNQQSI